MIPPSIVPTYRAPLSPELSFGYDSNPEAPSPSTPSSNHMSAAAVVAAAAPVPLAYQMYERLRRMSDERKLNLSEEDVLISAYLGPNLVYRTGPAAKTTRTTTTVDHPNGPSCVGPLHVETGTLTL